MAPLHRGACCLTHHAATHRCRACYEYALRRLLHLHTWRIRFIWVIARDGNSYTAPSLRKCRNINVKHKHRALAAAGIRRAARLLLGTLRWFINSSETRASAGASFVLNQQTVFRAI